MKIRDNRTVNYNLAPQLVVPTQELIDRANQLRQDTLQYGATPVGRNAAEQDAVPRQPTVIRASGHARPEPLPAS